MKLTIANLKNKDSKRRLTEGGEEYGSQEKKD
jgi:hypothetical protein